MKEKMIPVETVDKHLDIPFKEFMPGQVIQSAQFNDDMRDIEDKTNELIDKHNTIVETAYQHISNRDNPHAVNPHQIGTYTGKEIGEFINDVKSGNLYDDAITERVMGDDSVSNRTIRDGSVTVSKTDSELGTQLNISKNISIIDIDNRKYDKEFVYNKVEVDENIYNKPEVDELLQQKLGDGTYSKEELDEKFQEVQAGQIVDSTISTVKVTNDFGEKLDISKNPSITNKYTKDEINVLLEEIEMPKDWGSIVQSNGVPIVDKCVVDQIIVSGNSVYTLSDSEGCKAIFSGDPRSSYFKTVWVANETVITANKMNKIENELERLNVEGVRVDEEHVLYLVEKYVAIQMSDIQKDYDSLKKVIIDENASANLQNQINTLDSELETIQNQNVYMYKFPRLNGETTDLHRINRALASISDRGSVIFENKTYSINGSIEVLKDNINLIGNGAIIEISNQSNSNPIFFIRKGSNSTIRDFELRSLSQTPKTNNTQGINIRMAENITIENIVFKGLTYGIKVDTDTNIVNVKNLITNNLKFFNGVMFIHMSCCDGWQGNNLYCDLGLSNTTNLDHCYYIKPYVKNVQLSNVICKNTNGHAMQLNRWLGDVLSVPWGEESAINSNFSISNMTVENVNSPFMFNSEVSNFAVNNLNVIKTNSTTNMSHWGIVNLYKGKAKNVKINTAVVNGCYCFITSGTENLLGEDISFNNITYNSIFKYNNVAIYNVNNLSFSNSSIADVEDGNATSPFVQLHNTKLNINNLDVSQKNINKTIDLIRLASGNITLDINNLNYNIATKGASAIEVQLVNKTSANIDSCIMNNVKTKNITHIYKNFTPLSNFLVKDGVVQ